MTAISTETYAAGTYPSMYALKNILARMFMTAYQIHKMSAAKR